MSLSSPKKKERGPLERVIVGLNMAGLGNYDMPCNGDQDRDSSQEFAFLERVRDKARSVAKEVISRALQDAQTLRQQAYEEGYRSGQRQGLGDLMQRFEQLVGALDGEKAKILRAFRNDLISLTRLAVEKAVKLELQERRQECLAGLLEEALSLVDSHRELHITCHPDDKPLLDDLLKQASSRHPSLTHWKIRKDPSLQGGLVMECENGMVDNSLNGRWSSVSSILEKLNLDGED